MTDFEFLLALMAEADRRYAERFVSQEKAISVAETNSEKWRANANEWRAAMTDRETRFASHMETNIKLQALNERLNTLEAYKLSQEGRGAGLSLGWRIILGAFGFALTLLLITNTILNLSR